MITVVTGLPRSGTSLLLQMLDAGGLCVLTDGKRLPDADNPRGYFEWERIKQLPQDPALIACAEDKAVKVIAPLLACLPDGPQYRVLLMRRPIEEVFASQAVMIRRRAASGGTLGPEALMRAMEDHLRGVIAAMERRPNCRLHPVDYHALLGEPRRESEVVRDFLELELDVAAMAAQVDPSLYRQRCAAAP
jgi:hypothetical protein